MNGNNNYTVAYSFPVGSCWAGRCTTTTASSSWRTRTRAASTSGTRTTGKPTNELTRHLYKGKPTNELTRHLWGFISNVHKYHLDKQYIFSRNSMRIQVDFIYIDSLWSIVSTGTYARSAHRQIPTAMLHVNYPWVSDDAVTHARY